MKMGAVIVMARIRSVANWLFVSKVNRGRQVSLQSATVSSQGAPIPSAYHRRFCSRAILGIFFGVAVSVAIPSVLLAEDRVDYLTQIKPLLKERCYACHGALKEAGGLRLDTALHLKKGGDSGSSIDVKAPPEESELISRVSSTDLSVRMPPEHEGEPLNAAQISLLKRWIAAGASAPEDEAPETHPRDHWSFRPIVRPAIPVVGNANWVRNPIDAFIAQGHQEQGLRPQVEASRQTLLRRLSMDLIGLPPTLEEIAACESDSSPEWYENTVDRLLNDPRHGERWARHWMDNWRYSDWWGLGAQLRNSQRHMWHWRDWIVESLNNDTAYDEMVRLMLAADELAPTDASKLRASGFLARNYYIFNRTRWMDETVEHVGKGFLGLTMNCAKCHDHKFDPISHVDYYKMKAFFEPYQVRVDMVPGELDVVKNGIPRAFDALLEAPTYVYVRGDDSKPDTSAIIPPGIPEIFSFDSLEINPVSLPPEAYLPGRREEILESHVTAAKQRLQTASTKLTAAQDALKSVEKQMLAAGEKQAADPMSAGDEGKQYQIAIVDDFSTLDESRWKRIAGTWVHEPGKLKQTIDGPSRSVLQLQQQIPQNFEAKFRFQTLGGSKWRSVGIAFDTVLETADGSDVKVDDHKMVYMSAEATAPKLQASYQHNAKQHYPGDGARPMPIELNREYTLVIRVRDTLVNVSIDGKHVLAWRSPIARRNGALQLITFDALTVFHEFTLDTLNEDVELTEAGNKAGKALTALEDAQGKVATAESEQAVAQAHFDAVQTRAAAMRFNPTEEQTPAAVAAKNSAIKAERQLAVAEARLKFTASEESLKRAVADKKDDEAKKLKAAQEALDKAVQAASVEIQPTDKFTPLAGAEWASTRFLHTGNDDPKVEFPTTSTGRRTALANWITDRRNPLTSRVAVNHLWTRHFGQPLVSIPFDFGRNTPDPVHPELIDWLASELMDHGWSMKHIHRLIVTSNTYRMSSSMANREVEAAQDPDNRYLWRRVPIRVESQAVRDSILALAGTLDPAIGGPSVPMDQQETSMRRSLYFFHSNNERNLFLTTFDEAMVGECYLREQSIVPQQALALSNSALVSTAAEKISQRLSKTSASEADFVRNAFKLIPGFVPTANEMRACIEALAAWKNLPETSDEQARAKLILVLLNHNDFVTLR
ncbi:DUF1553 domain-containing protein [Planctomicrobium sp. SH527]|uniref:PSD1 and planctomycete cytochrome C domain-containing protein n=1 Tax=Planctomicrobium sp. SH527 TaxID=3448123 RepID=UPI003F5BFFB3